MESLEKSLGYALRLLKFRPRSEAELRQRLSRKGISSVTVEFLISECKRKGLIDDEKFARYLATQKMMVKPVGRRMLVHELKSKGINPLLVEQAVQEATEGKQELDVARELARGRILKLAELKPEVARRRLFGFLSRRGFSSEVVYQVVREME